jgi:hypothetical protein
MVHLPRHAPAHAQRQQRSMHQRRSQHAPTSSGPGHSSDGRHQPGMCWTSADDLGTYTSGYIQTPANDHCRKAVPPPVCGAPAPEGWYFPRGLEDGSLPCPDILLPKELLVWENRMDLGVQYGIGTNPLWIADDHLKTFTTIKLDIQAFGAHFTRDFNSLRDRPACLQRTIHSEFHLPLSLV